LIEASIALSRPLANRKGTHIKAQYPERIPTLTLDWRKMTQVFLNLIGNSIKFCQNGGLVEVTVMLEPAHLVFHVRDNGPGISPDELESIFMPFQRGSGSASAQPGTGLGLAICKRIVERHGGRIWAENAVGGGAVLYLSLPLRGLGNENGVVGN
jgi:signal transduction histidine kinase